MYCIHRPLFLQILIWTVRKAPPFGKVWSLLSLHRSFGRSQAHLLLRRGALYSHYHIEHKHSLPIKSTRVRKLQLLYNVKRCIQTVNYRRLCEWNFSSDPFNSVVITDKIRQGWITIRYIYLEGEYCTGVVKPKSKKKLEWGVAEI